MWGLLRVMVGGWAALVSALRPLTPVEQAVPLWPPMSLGTWLYRVILSPWERWDVGWYLQIVERGYRAGDGTAQFHPLFPWLASVLVPLLGSPLLSLFLLSSGFSVLFLLLFERWARLDYTADEVNRALVLLLFSPYFVPLLLPYTESLFLFLAVLAFWAARKRRWWLAGAAGGLATLTRQQGLFLLLPLLWEYWESQGKTWRGAKVRREEVASAAALLCIPGAYLGWTVYRVAFLEKISLQVNSFHDLVYAFFVSPSAEQVVPVQRFLWPWRTLGLAWARFRALPDVDLGVNLVLAGGFLVLVALSWSQLRFSCKMYTLVIILVSFSYYTGPEHPYMGLPRHLLLAFPALMGFARLAEKRWLRLLSLLVGGLGTFFVLLLYVLNTWVP
ncbi:MAG: glycosyltransferase family 39 protein [Anaerolineae bacterium]